MSYRPTGKTPDERIADLERQVASLKRGNQNRGRISFTETRHGDDMEISQVIVPGTERTGLQILRISDGEACIIDPPFCLETSSPFEDGSPFGCGSVVQTYVNNSNCTATLVNSSPNESQAGFELPSFDVQATVGDILTVSVNVAGRLDTPGHNVSPTTYRGPAFYYTVFGICGQNQILYPNSAEYRKQTQDVEGPNYSYFGTYLQTGEQFSLHFSTVAATTNPTINTYLFVNLMTNTGNPYDVDLTNIEYDVVGIAYSVMTHASECSGEITELPGIAISDYPSASGFVDLICS